MIVSFTTLICRVVSMRRMREGIQEVVLLASCCKTFTSKLNIQVAINVDRLEVELLTILFTYGFISVGYIKQLKSCPSHNIFFCKLVNLTE